MALNSIEKNPSFIVYFCVKQCYMNKQIKLNISGLCYTQLLHVTSFIAT